MEIKKYVEELKQHITNAIKHWEEEYDHDLKYEDQNLDDKRDIIFEFGLIDWEWEYDPSLRLGSFYGEYWTPSMNTRFEYARPYEDYSAWMIGLSFFIANESWFRVEQEFKRYIDHVANYETKELIKHDSDFPDDEEIGNTLEW